MWDRLHHRLALLELTVTGKLKRRREQDEAWHELVAMGWVRRAGPEDERVLVNAHRSTIENMLGKRWPGWRSVAVDLAAHGLPPTSRGLERLEDLQRQATLVTPLPAQLNHRTAIAAVGPHSKAILTGQRRLALSEVDLTRDGIIRLRPNRDLQLRRHNVTLAAAACCEVLGEVALPERALQDGLELDGPAPALVLLVENVGPYIDIPAPSDWLVAHVPGWNTRTAQLLLTRLPTVPLLLFGDLDPAGVAIAAHLRSHDPSLRWVVFDLWRELLPEYAQPGIWPEDQDFAATPALIQELVHDSIWLEQERLTLHPNLVTELLAVAGLAGPKPLIK